jgi:hypothetical protein
MRPSFVVRALGTAVAAALLIACGSSGPTTPGGVTLTTLQIPTGPQVLRIVYQSSLCAAFDGDRFIPMIYTPVTVTRAGSEWIATASGATAGDVELRIREVSAAGITVRVAGTIKGTAIHLPELAVGLPAWDSRVNFGSDGRAALNGVIFPLSPSTTTGAFDGIGTGAITFSDSAGRSCSGTSSFSWSLFPQM